MKKFPPGSRIGILGGGQLGRMTAQAAAKLGYHVHIFCQEVDEPAIEVSAVHTLAAFDDGAALTTFARSVDVVTLEWENVPLKTLQSIEAHAPVYPGARVLEIAQDRGLEKRFANSIGVSTTDFVIVKSPEALEEALQTFSRPCVLKSTRMGYDGKGQAMLGPDMTVAQAWAEMGSGEGILESFVDFEMEVSVIVARRADGQAKAFPVVQNIHRNHILFETHAPALLNPTVAEEAQVMALKLAEKLDVVGLLAVEMFVLRKPNKKGQRVLMNEIAPRPHNSGHWTMEGCSCSQFEQLVRAVCGLPLADIAPLGSFVMRNLLGDESLAYETYLSDPSASLHLYGKKESRAGRKMGHVTMRK